MLQYDVYCIKLHQMKKRITISLSEESYIKLQLLAKKKKWSLSKTVEDILERQMAKQKQAVQYVGGIGYEKSNP
jgi:macrodomain Ter protein organizer (MatP/YcbG family)